MKLGISSLLSAALLASTAVADSFSWERLEKNNSVLVIVDHQEGLFNLVHDYDPIVFKHNMMAYTSLGTVFPEVPVVITTSAETGPNGLIPEEIRSWYPNAPLIRRNGEVDAWDDPAFRAAIRATNRTQIIIAGIVTDVCTAFLARSLRAEGYSVWAAIEASGTTSSSVRDIANAQMLRAGVNVVSLFAILCDLMRDWRHVPGAEELYPWIDKWMPNYAYVARAHKNAANNGTVVPGQKDLPE
ncbi:isochorismatase [Naviculisporaceae sp. PSN 640]